MKSSQIVLADFRNQTWTNLAEGQGFEGVLYCDIQLYKDEI